MAPLKMPRLTDVDDGAHGAEPEIENLYSDILPSRGLRQQNTLNEGLSTNAFEPYPIGALFHAAFGDRPVILIINAIRDGNRNRQNGGVLKRLFEISGHCRNVDNI